MLILKLFTENEHLFHTIFISYERTDDYQKYIEYIFENIFFPHLLLGYVTTNQDLF